MLAAKKIGNSPLESIKVDPIDYSFWDIIDLDITFSESLKSMKMAYNQSLPSKKGMLKEAETTTAKILIHLMCEEMEYLRLHQSNDYLHYLSDKMDSFPIRTNRGQLRTMMDKEYSLRSYSNFIDRLMSAQIILRKLNTSRQITKVKDENGNITKVVNISKNGRGDFILFINKKALTFKFDVVDSPQVVEMAPKIAAENAIENQSISPSKMQKMQQPHQYILETNKNSNHKCGESGVPVEQTENKTSAIAAEMKLHRNEAGKIPNFEIPENVQKKGFDVENYRAQLEKDFEIQKSLPQRDLDYFASLLFYQMKSTIYRDFEEEYMNSIEAPAKNLLRLHMSRLGLESEIRFQSVARAIQMVYNHLQKHQSAYVYAPLTWLRLDEEFKMGTLRHVIDYWIPKEQKRLQKFEKSNSDLVKWQYAVYHSDRLFKEVVMALREGFSNGVVTYKTAFSKLDYLFEKYELSEKLRTKIRKQFADKTYSILTELEKLGRANLKQDKIWNAFQLWRKMNGTSPVKMKNRVKK